MGFDHVMDWALTGHGLFTTHWPRYIYNQQVTTSQLEPNLSPDQTTTQLVFAIKDLIFIIFSLREMLNYTNTLLDKQCHSDCPQSDDTIGISSSSYHNNNKKIEKLKPGEP